MYVQVAQDDGKRVERYGVTDVTQKDGKVRVWFGPDPPEEAEEWESIEGTVDSVISERTFGPKWEAKEAIAESAQNRSVVDLKVVAVDAYPAVEEAARELKADTDFVDDFELIA